MIEDFDPIESDEFKFAIITLAAFRLARLLVVDAGPNDVLLRFRTWLGVYSFNQNGQPAGGTIAKLFTCSHCIGFWVALLFALICYRKPKILTMWLAIAGGQSLLQSIAKGK